MGYKECRSAAADIFHGHFEEVHEVYEDFRSINHMDSVNKIMHLLGHLHSIGGAQYQQDSDYPQIWLMSNGKTVLNQLITDAEASKLAKAAKSLKSIYKDLAANKLVK